MNALVITDIKTMSSVEIAELTGKRHDNVMTDIRKTLKELGNQSPDFSGERIFGNNRKQKIFNLPKRECLILVSGYSVKLRASIVDRWQELENQHQQPAKLSRMDILQMAVQSEEENQKLIEEIKVIEPKAKALDRIATADGSLTVTDTAKNLGIRPIDLTRWMSQSRWIYKRAGGKEWIAYQDRIQSGFLEHKTRTIKVRGFNSYGESEIMDKIVIQVRVLPKGLTKLSTDTVIS